MEEEQERFAANPGIMMAGERWWKRHYDFLQDRGYTLRARYTKDWTPSWKKKGKFFDEVEDGQILHVRPFVHAIELCCINPILSRAQS